MRKQVDKSHYDFNHYMTKRRWASMWHQLDEVTKLNPEHILEIGPGPGLFKATAIAMGLEVETLDIDPNLEPDHVASVFNMPFKDNSYDVVCAFQMLEHLPFEQSLVAFREMVRVARKAIIISLPNAAKRWPMSIYIPKFGSVNFSIPKLRFGMPTHEFDGQHYWELNKKSFSKDEVVRAFCNKNQLELVKNYRVSENPYHHFFIFRLK